MEPPRSRVRGRRPAGGVAAVALPRVLTSLGPARLFASAGCAAMALAATGDAVLAAVLAAVAVADLAAGVGVLAAAVAVAVRWGTSSLEGIGGDQAVLGAAGLVGPALAAASAWCAGASLLAAPAAGRRSVVVAVCVAPLAALVVAGPTDAGGLPVRVAATVLAVGAALALARRARPAAAGTASALLGAAALALAVVS